MVPSASKCITWNVVFAAEIVAIVTVNLLSIILFIKTRSLRTRSMYLVISLTVADMLVGGLSGAFKQVLILQECHFVQFPFQREVVITLLFFLPSSLPDKHCYDFFRASARHVSSNRAPDYQEMGLRGSNCCCLGSPCYHISHLDGSSPYDRILPFLLWISLLFVFICYLCFLHRNFN